MRRPDRLRAALVFALAGAGAAALHVWLDTPGALRDWRQSLPLGALAGAAVGAALRPRGALAGGVAALAGLALAATAFAAAHAAISGAAFAGGLASAARALAGVGGLAALALGALAGRAGGRR